jgi:membrane protease YdiL (CAAX protease family)
VGHRRTAAGPGSRRRGDAGFAIASCAVLAAYNNVAGTRPWHRRWYPVLNAAATGAALAAAAASGLTATDMGLGRTELRPGLQLGSRLAAATAGGWLAIAVVPAARPVLRDQRITGLTGREVAYQVMVRIPVGTVLWEEAAFRGVLLAALRRVMPRGTAVAVASGVFGSWHIRPTIGALRANKLAAGPGKTVAAVTAAVAATAAGGVLLSWLRIRSGSLAAPVLLHLAANCTGPLAAYAIAHLAANGGQVPPRPARTPRPPRTPRDRLTT